MSRRGKSQISRTIQDKFRLARIRRFDLDKDKKTHWALTHSSKYKPLKKKCNYMHKSFYMLLYAQVLDMHLCILQFSNAHNAATSLLVLRTVVW